MQCACRKQSCRSAAAAALEPFNMASARSNQQHALPLALSVYACVSMS